MADLIQFLESIGRTPESLTSAGYVAAVESLDIDEAQRQALLDRDPVALGRLFDGRAQMFCLVVPAEDEPEDEDDEDEDDEDSSIRLN